MTPAYPLEVSVTCPDEATAIAIGREAIERRLAACANVSGPVRSIFRWSGAVEDDEEWSLSLKSRRGCFEALAEMIRALHPYDLPAIVAHEAIADPATAAWIEDETR